MKKIYQKPPTYNFTPEGLQKFKEEYQQLLADRPDAVEHLKKAREMGDLSENGYYKASKFKLISIDNRLRRHSFILKNSKIIQTNHSGSIALGSTVTISDGKNEMEYTIVGVYEANPAEGKISDFSPLGKALIGKKIGEKMEIITPSGKKVYSISKIS